MCIRKLLNKIFYISKIHYHGKNNKFICSTSVCLKKVKIVFYNLEDMIISIVKDKDFITFLINKDFSIDTKFFF